MAPSAADPLGVWLQERLGVRMVALTPVGGGCIHKAWCLQGTGQERLFLKTNRAERLPLLQAEAEGLRALAKVAPSSLLIPSPMALGLAGEQAVLVLPWIDLDPGRGSPGAWNACGRDLARMHRTSLLEVEGEAGSGSFGWRQDNYIGASPQLNGWRSDWGTFFTECRLAPQLDWLARSHGPLEGAQWLLEHLPEWLESHEPEPCLVHGDLWRGNLGLVRGGGGSLFDPATYRGDREVDLAMARLFGGVPEDFFTGYLQEWPLPQGWQSRSSLYDLYHLLNHANLFGASYKKQAQETLATLLGQLR